MLSVNSRYSFVLDDFRGAFIREIDRFMYIAGFGVTDEERGEERVSCAGGVLNLYPLYWIQFALIFCAQGSIGANYFFCECWSEGMLRTFIFKIVYLNKLGSFYPLPQLFLSIYKNITVLFAYIFYIFFGQKTFVVIRDGN